MGLSQNYHVVETSYIVPKNMIETKVGQSDSKISYMPFFDGDSKPLLYFALYQDILLNKSIFFPILMCSSLLMHTIDCLQELYCTFNCFIELMLTVKL